MQSAQLLERIQGQIERFNALKQERGANDPDVKAAAEALVNADGELMQSLVADAQGDPARLATEQDFLQKWQAGGREATVNALLQEHARALFTGL